jgi:hypothetical protein
MWMRLECERKNKQPFRLSTVSILLDVKFSSSPVLLGWEALLFEETICVIPSTDEPNESDLN